MENQEFNPPPVQSSPTPKLVYVLIVGLVLVLVGIGGYLLGTKKTSAPAPTIPPKTATKYPAATTSDEMVGWKTYKNNLLGFEFKYPNESNWFVKEESNTLVTLYNYDVDKAPGRSYDPVADKDLFKIEISIDDKNQSVDQWFTEEKNKINPAIDRQDEFLNIKNITVDSKKGIYFENKVWDIIAGTAVFETPNKNLIYFASGLSFEKYKSIFSQILSTFKFLPATGATSSPQAVTDEIMEWKVFNNSDLTFKYPVNWNESYGIISSTDPSVRLVPVPKDSTLMNECMQETTREKKGNVFIKKFSSVVSGAMCTGEGGNFREIWVIPSADAYSPGLSYRYPLSDSTKTELIFDQILSTFRFD